MNEYMLYIRNAAHAKATLSEQAHFAFVKECEVYINRLKSEEKLIAAQPISPEGIIISKNKNEWTQATLDTDLVQVGYYHIQAASMDEAIEIAKANPEFEYVPTASIEVRAIKTKEEKTNFIYPK